MSTARGGGIFLSEPVAIGAGQVATRLPVDLGPDRLVADRWKAHLSEMLCVRMLCVLSMGSEPGCSSDNCSIFQPPSPTSTHQPEPGCCPPGPEPRTTSSISKGA